MPEESRCSVQREASTGIQYMVFIEDDTYEVLRSQRSRLTVN